MLSVNDKQTILRDVFLLKEARIVPVLVQPFGKWYATRDVMEDWALDLARQTQRNAEQAQVADFHAPHLKTGIGLGALAASFAGACEWNDESDAWVTSAAGRELIGERPERVHELALPDPRTSGLNGFIHERIAYFQEHGALPLQPCNIASPLTTASYIWGYNDFLVAMKHAPREVHHLLELVTQATIAWVRAQMVAIRDLWALSHEDWWMPVEMGIRMSDDVLSVISPRAYREFGVRYNNMLSRAFGGVAIHSCGDIAFQIPTILEHEGLRAIDLTLPHNDARKVAEAAAGKVALTMRYWLQDWEDRRPPDLERYTDEAVDAFGTRGVLLQMQTPTLADAIDLAARFRGKKWGMDG